MQFAFNVMRISKNKFWKWLKFVFWLIIWKKNKKSFGRFFFFTYVLEKKKYWLNSKYWRRTLLPKNRSHNWNAKLVLLLSYPTWEYQSAPSPTNAGKSNSYLTITFQVLLCHYNAITKLFTFASIVILFMF
jgi:hypothetical protein